MKHFLVSSLALLALLNFISCKKQEPDSLVSKDDFFETTKLLTDSINVSLKMSAEISVASTDGEFVIKFSANDPCPKNTCSTCDFGEGVVRIILKHKLDSVALTEIRLFRCGKTPIYYQTASCSQPKNNFSSYSTHGKLIFSIKELSPYPETITASNDLYYNNKYTLNLTIRNICD